MLWLLAGSGSAHAVVFVSPEINTTPTPDNFSICFDNSCQSIRQLALPDHRWQEIRDIFRAGAHSPEEERRLIGQAVARLERIIGGMTGTANDKGANETSDNPLDHRMDCIDESTNTTSYLYLLQQDGLLRWHRLRDPVTRGFFFFGWPHTTAVIEAREDRRLWAVDSWFHDNGIAPEILPLEHWKQGWSPDPR
ncbi:hypothetical protein [Sedimenticola hydrogenitrophicus]|uniref:hypothetical protein n=1 Tax=Sedimenticola hydrogenitrophicus TaxID=2967975 RepID=UPI0023AE8B17|nr:hypothetical protein [Sedimenticola hydrogenitrophicus]